MAIILEIKEYIIEDGFPKKKIKDNFISSDFPLTLTTVVIGAALDK